MPKKNAEGTGFAIEVDRSDSTPDEVWVARCQADGCDEYATGSKEEVEHWAFGVPGDDTLGHKAEVHPTRP